MFRICRHFGFLSIFSKIIIDRKLKFSAYTKLLTSFLTTYDCICSSKFYNHYMFNVCRHNVNISQKSCFTFKTKISTGQLSCLAFQPSSSEHSWWISPSIYSAFSSIKTWTVPPYSFCACC